jgi:5-methylthioadenosine/S-adenosylhomocysteine deaminase
MQSVNQVIHTRWLITCEEENKILENHALVMKEGLITDILPSEKAAIKYPSTETHHYPDHVIMPGFVNSHTHIAMNLFRGLADDLALMDWLNNHIWPAEKAWVSHQFVYDASLLAMAEMIRSGTTCFNDMYFFLQATAEAAELAGIRANIGITVIGMPTTWAKTFAEYIAKGLEFYNQYKNHPLIKTTFAPHAIYTVSDPELIKIRELAEQHDLKINMHVQETAEEIKQSMALTKLRPLRRLHNLGLISPRLIAIHMTQIDKEDLEILAAHKPNIVHCPESNMKLASGISPLAQLKALGINVALGTDGAASNNDLNMFSEMRSASFLSKVSTENPVATSAAEVLRMATLHGAKALGLDKITGSLTIGKAADFIAIDLNRIETLPHYHPASALVYNVAREQVTDVWVAGKQLMRNRELLTLDEAAIKAKAVAWQQKIKAKASLS